MLGIDFSSAAIELARARAERQGLCGCEFLQLRIEDLPGLGRGFDYVNCDGVLCMLPDPVEGLRALASVLKPHGIARVNFHSVWQHERGSC